MRFPKALASLLFATLVLFACEKKEPVSTIDPLPMPAGMEKNKDLTVTPAMEQRVKQLKAENADIRRFLSCSKRT